MKHISKYKLDHREKILQIFKQSNNFQHGFTSMNRIPSIFIPILAPIFLFSCFGAHAASREVEFAGKTMGTTYHITVVADGNRSTDGLQKQIDEELEQVNQEMSVYRSDSEISRFNSFNRAGVGFAISENFMEVLNVSKSVYEITDGAWDGTVNPLLEVWGFRSKESPSKIPEKEKIEEILSRIGFDQIILSDRNHVIKKDPAVTLDLASIAKGHGVDRVSGVLLKNGFKNFIVEIGGEIYASGHAADNKPWKAGINTPRKFAPFDEVYKVIALTDAAMATSGDNRNFVEIEGRQYSHIIDPRTGYPVKNNVAAATIIAATCAFADGLATAVMVMGLEKSLLLIDRLAGVEGLVITRNPDGGFSNHYSKGLSPR